MTPRSKRLTAYGSVLLLVVASLTAATAVAAAPAAASSQELCGPGSALSFHRSAFPAKPEIDNKWLRLEPGRQYTTTGKVVSPDGTTARTVISTVTGLTKVIDGVKTIAIWDRDYRDGELVESELAFFAQTRKGAVWLFGEYPEEYENGKLVGAPSTFISGIDEARAGIAMQAKPHRNTPAYAQAYAPSVDFLDCGDVFAKHLRVCVPTGCYDDVMVIDEFNPLEPPSAGHQRKYYAPRTGLIKVTAVGGEEQEFMDLVKIKKLNRTELASVNAHALAIDRRGYTVSKDVYAKTPRAVVKTR
ncbi:hypothetical protein SAMN04487916_107230 [Arthrobacter sp. ov407]|uniref:hypothetical protein n=1 Tax=Arthrobacter sp. ov407 TaxID=1761748 RepID=UPI00088A6191|nr:hypothetical protein [Arthrobacter sp. ov407]SDL30291.1 hypothetical protein SAMN04487916_107230 [Arthrobacter sp. ov407]